MQNIIWIFMAAMFMTGPISAQIAANTEQFSLFDGTGNKTNLNAITSSLGQYDVVFLGEARRRKSVMRGL